MCLEGDGVLFHDDPSRDNHRVKEIQEADQLLAHRCKRRRAPGQRT